MAVLELSGDTGSQVCWSHPIASVTPCVTLRQCSIDGCGWPCGDRSGSRFGRPQPRRSLRWRGLIAPERPAGDAGCYGSGDPSIRARRSTRPRQGAGCSVSTAFPAGRPQCPMTARGAPNITSGRMEAACEHMAWIRTKLSTTCASAEGAQASLSLLMACVKVTRECPVGLTPPGRLMRAYLRSRCHAVAGHRPKTRLRPKSGRITIRPLWPARRGAS